MLSMKIVPRKNKAQWEWALLAGLFLLAIVFGPSSSSAERETGKADMDYTTNILFIHHSCGGILLADTGAKEGGEKGSPKQCIYGSHPNGGGLRTKLEAEGYQVNQLSYGSRLGQDTDIHHWRAKFADNMEELLRTQEQEYFLPNGQSNSIVVFKSCYPNNNYIDIGEGEGDPDSDIRSIANSKAAYNALLPLFKKRPDVLFVALTPPPLAKPKAWGIKARLKALFGIEPRSGKLARKFNNWMADPKNGWLAEYPMKNIVVFDYYDILTENGKSNWSRFPTRDGADSHPSLEGNVLAADLFMPFLADAIENWEGNQQ